MNNELTLTIDQLNRNTLYEDIEADAISVTLLFAAERGKNPIHPEMGFNIRRYRYSEIESAIDNIKSDFLNHCQIWLPRIRIQDMTILKRGENTLYINLLISTDTYQSPYPVSLQVLRGKNETFTLNRIINQ